MRRRDYYWCLYHTPEKNQLDNLRTDQVEAVFAAIPAAQKGEWLIWRDGMDSWKSFEDFPQLLISLRRIGEQPAPAPPLPNLVSDETQSNINRRLALDDATAEGLSLEERAMAEDRKSMRFDKALEVRLQIGERMYANTTVNVSMSGMQLRDQLPPNLPQYFNVEIRKGDQVIPVVCSEVKSGSGNASSRLRIEANDYANALLSLLLSGGANKN